MKQLNIYLLLFLAFAFNAHAQDNDKVLPEIPATTRYLSEKDGLFSTKGMSANTALLLVDLMQLKNNPSAIKEKELVKKYGLISKSGKLYANSFLLGTKGFTTSSLGELGVLPGTKSGDVFTALLPVEHIAEIVKQPNVRYVDIGSVSTTFMDSARSQTNVNKVHAGMAPLNTPYTGKGVVVGDIDLGFDFTHPNFYDSTGQYNYRVKRVWDQVNPNGTPPSGYTYGSEYITEAQILNAKHDFVGAIVNFDHASHTAGTAAGAGGYPGSPYRGVAYESDIVLVSSLLDGAQVVDAIKYIQDYAKSVGKPCVINMSFGDHDGPHDGTTSFDRALDSLAGPGKLLVQAAGNDGLNPMYIDHKFLLSDTAIYTFAVMGHKFSGSGTVNVWGKPNENFAVRVMLLNTKTNTIMYAPAYKVSAAVGGIIIDSLSTIFKTTYTAEINPLSSKPHVKLEFENKIPDSFGIRVLLEVTGYNTSIQMWGTQKGVTDFSSLGYKSSAIKNATNTTIDGRMDHTVSDGGNCSNGVITVGAYTSKNQWMSLNNKQCYPPVIASVGDIAPFSSMGPTADGRTKPDITAPGNILASSVNSFSSAFNALSDRTVKSVTYGSKTWYFGMMEGTSMACPMVTGIVALWLQKYPNLTREQALNMMKKTAITDNYTGTIPATGSNTWGWGKINAFMGLTLSVEKAAVKNTLKVYPNPTNNELHIAFDKQANNAMITIADITGKVVYSKNAGNLSGGSEQVVNMENNPAGMYMLRIVSNGEEAVYKIAKQ